MVDEDFSTIITAGHYYYYPSNESKKIFCCFDVRYYDEIITRLRLQAIKKYQYDTPQHQQREKLQQKREGKGEEELHEHTRKKRILLVDDEPDVCMAYQIVLEGAGYECTSYIDPVTALKEFKPSYYDLTILDIKMPNLNGFELCKKITKIDKTIQVIFITAGEEYHKEYRNERYYLELSDDDNSNNINYVQKPIGNQELIQLVNMIIATKDKN
jgi:CheY-like chemotaxis protein